MPPACVHKILWHEQRHHRTCRRLKPPQHIPVQKALPDVLFVQES